MSEIDGVKKLSLPFTEATQFIEYYKRMKDPVVNTPSRDLKKEAYNTLTEQEKQELSDAENLVFEVKRRAKILLEREQREREDAQAQLDGIKSGYNKPFLPTPEEIDSKFSETLTPEEQTKIDSGIVAKNKLDIEQKRLADEIVQQINASSKKKTDKSAI